MVNNEKVVLIGKGNLSGDELYIFKGDPYLDGVLVGKAELIKSGKRVRSKSVRMCSGNQIAAPTKPRYRVEVFIPLILSLWHINYLPRLVLTGV